ncbi:MAG TPA: outer membrane beta-barrel family protein, partial [Puia sp.]|nr:outer membrane beta-barrel family protein [Puia sp.]
HASSFGGVPVATNTSAPGSFYIANGGGQVGFDYQADKRTVIGGLVSGYGFGNLVGIRSFNSGTYLTGSEVDSVTRLYDHEIHNTYNLNANLNLEHQFSSATKLVANVDYLHWLDDNPISYRDSTSGASGEGGYGRVLSSHKRTVIHTWVAQADYSRQLSPAVTLLTGLKGTLSRFVNAVDVDSLTGKGWDREAGFSAMGTLNEAYPAAYVSVKAQVDPKTAINGGLRYEYTDSRLRSDTGSGLHRRYGDWFPTVLLSRQLGKAGSFDVSVNRRITRPTFNDMAPWVLLIDDYTIFSGNPGLLPALLDNASLHYSYRKADLNLSYSYERHSISDFFPSVNPETHVETLSAINLDYTKVLSASFSVPVRVSSWWKMSWSVNTEWRRMEVNGSAGQGPGGAGMGLGGSIAAERWSAKLTASQDFSLPSDWSASASGYYQSPSSDGYYATSSCGSLDLAVRKNFGTAGKLTVNATNVLNSLGQVYSMTQPNLVTRLYVRFQYPGVRVTYTRSFGNNGVKGHRERETGAETERERVK